MFVCTVVPEPVVGSAAEGGETDVLHGLPQHGRGSERHVASWGKRIVTIEVYAVDLCQ